MLHYLALGNLISGSVPPELGNLVRLKNLVIDNTKLSGPLPLSLMNLNLRELSFFGTRICIPADPNFQAWLESIEEVQGTEISCD
jgi:hypothetical protein